MGAPKLMKTLVVSIVLGGIAGFIGYFAVFMATFIQFANMVPGQDEMGGVTEAVPGPFVMVGLVAWGAAAAGFLGWRLGVRRQKHDTAT